MESLNLEQFLERVKKKESVSRFDFALSYSQDNTRAIYSVGAWLCLTIGASNWREAVK